MRLNYYKPITFFMCIVFQMSLLGASSPLRNKDIDELYFHGTTDHPDAIYAAGEEMSFAFALKNKDGKLDRNQWVKWTRMGDDGKEMSEIVHTKDQNPIVVKTSLDMPGFVRVSVLVCDAKGKRMKGFKVWKLSLDCSAGVELEKIKAGVAEPADFDSFWNQQKSELSKVPMKVLEKKLIKKTHGKNVYDVKISCLGKRPVSGYLAIPKNAKKGSLPVTVRFRGYGVSGAYEPIKFKGIGFEINAHGIENGRKKEYYKALNKGELKHYGFSEKENASRDTSYFKGMLLRVIRALEYVKTLPEWDGKTINVVGGSQGGMQALAAAGLDSDVTHCFVTIPWFCDLGGVKKGRMKGWRPKFTDALLYFDPVNHAKRIKCEVAILAGLGDSACPPSGIMVLYNNINTPVKLTFQQARTHSSAPKVKHDESILSKK